MGKDFYSKSYVDHFLQADILTRLVNSEVPLRFSELKESGVENSLFMYHVNKLIARGLVQKADDGFSLTTKGARWVNHAGVLHMFSVLTPRPLIQFVIRCGDQLLVATRKGQLKKHLNDYLLPGNIYRHGISLQDNVTLILQELFGDVALPKTSLITVADVIHTHGDDFVSHVICYIHSVELKTKPVLQDHPLFDAAWEPFDSVTIDSPRYAKSIFLPMLIQKLPTVQPHETFFVKNQ